MTRKRVLTVRPDCPDCKGEGYPNPSNGLRVLCRCVAAEWAWIGKRKPPTRKRKKQPKKRAGKVVKIVRG